MRDTFLFYLFKDKTVDDVIDCITSYRTRENIDDMHEELNITLDSTKLYYKEKKEDMPIRYFNEITREESKDLDIKELIKTVHINDKKKVVTVVLKNGQKGIARCHEQDTFDPQVGFAVALTYALFPSRTKALKYVAKQVEKNHKEK